jgi:hypothetical protein
MRDGGISQIKEKKQSGGLHFSTKRSTFNSRFTPSEGFSRANERKSMLILYYRAVNFVSSTRDRTRLFRDWVLSRLRVN